MPDCELCGEHFPDILAVEHERCPRCEADRQQARAFTLRLLTKSARDRLNQRLAAFKVREQIAKK